MQPNQTYQLPNPRPTIHAAQHLMQPTNFSCNPTICSPNQKQLMQQSPPSVCSYFQRLFYQKQLMQQSPPSVCSPYEGKKGKKITINTTFTSPPPPPHYPPPTSPPTYLTTTTTCSPSRHLHPHLLPSTHSHTPCTNTFHLLPLLRTQIFIHP